MEIENNRVLPSTTPESGQGTAVDSAGKAPSPSTGQSEAASASGNDSVTFTHTAKHLQQLEQQVAGLPVVDQQKVDAIRAAIESGSFSIDAGRIADKMISLESVLMDAR